MLSNNQKLQILEDEIDNIDEQIKDHCILWAQEYSNSLDNKDKPNEEIAELNGVIDSIDKKIKRLKEIIQEKQDAQIRMKEIKDSESEEHKGWGDFYQMLGKRSFDLYKKGQMNDSVELDDLFNPLMEFENKIRNADNELFKIRNKSEDSKVWERIGNFIKKSTQTTKKKSAGDALQKQYKKTGESLIEGGFFNEVAQNGLSDIYDQFQNKEALSKKFRDELVEITNRIEVLDSEIQEISEDKGPVRGLKNLEMNLEEAQVKLDNAYLRLGQELYGSEKLKNEPYRLLIDEFNIERTNKINSKSALLIEIRMGELKGNLEKKEKEILQQKEKIGHEQEKLDSLQQESDTIHTKIDQLKKEHETILSELKDQKND